MKNVLFTTTALVAFAGAAAAEVSFSGALTAGYNDEIEGGLFWEADLDLTGSVDLGDNVTAKVTVQMGDWLNNGGTDHNAITTEIAYTGDTLSASLKFGDLGDKGASEYYYADRDGMTQDVENHDGSEDVRAMVEFGNFGVAVGCSGVSDGECDGMNVGAGATFGSIEIGVGYDDGENGQVQRTAVSADAEFGAITVGVSYISAENHSIADYEFDLDDADDTVIGGGGTGGYFAAEDSIGVAVGYDVSDALSVGAYYANNSFLGDAYGVSVSFASGALSVDAYYDHEVGSAWVGIPGNDLDGDGSFTSHNWGIDTTDTYGLDASYAINDQLTANAGVMFTSSSSNRAFVPDPADSTVFYVGVDYAVNDNITATVSYADADEIGGPEYKDGITALITASF